MTTRRRKKEIITKYPPPSNCIIIDPPKINPEIRAVSLYDVIFKTDDRIKERQAKLTAGLGAIGKALFTILNEGKEKVDLALLENLNDVGTLLAYLQRDE